MCCRSEVAVAKSPQQPAKSYGGLPHSEQCAVSIVVLSLRSTCLFGVTHPSGDCTTRSSPYLMGLQRFTVLICCQTDL